MRPITHRVQGADKARIVCMTCQAPADLIHHDHWDTGNTQGVSFWPFCDACFVLQQEKRAARVVKGKHDASV